MGPPGFQNLQPTSQFSPQLAQEKKSNFEEIILQYMHKMDQFDRLAQSQQASIQNLERQIG